GVPAVPPRHRTAVECARDDPGFGADGVCGEAACAGVMCAAIGAASFDPGPNAGTKPCRVPPIQVSTLPPNSLFFIAFLHGCAAHGVTSRGIIDRHSQPAV